MFDKNDVDQLQNEFLTAFEARGNSYTGGEDVEALFGQGTEGVDTLLGIIRRVNSACVASLPNMGNLPKVNLYLSPRTDDDGATTSVIHLTTVTSRNSVVYLKGDATFSKNGFLDSVISYFETYYLNIIDKAAQYANIEVINIELEKALEDAGARYSVELTLSTPGRGNAVQYIDDNLIVYRVDHDKVFAEGVKGLRFDNNLDPEDFETEEEYHNIKKYVDKAHAALVAQIKGLPTTPKFLKAKLSIIELFVRVESYLPRTLIRKSINKTAAILRNSRKDERFRIEKDGMMAIGERVDGALGYSLSPFDENTCDPVDANLLEGLQ